MGLCFRNDYLSSLVDIDNNNFLLDSMANLHSSMDLANMDPCSHISIQSSLVGIDNNKRRFDLKENLHLNMD